MRDQNNNAYWTNYRKKDVGERFARATSGALYVNFLIIKLAS